MRQQAYEDVARRCGDELIKLIEYRGYRNTHVSISFSSNIG